MAPPPPPEEIAPLMHFIANKTKNVTSPINVNELCRQFKAESGSLLSVGGVQTRIRLHRLRIHEMNEFDMGTKVKMMFALSAPINAGFLKEMKKVADVEVDDQQRIIQYKQKDGGLELSDQGEQRDRDMIHFLAVKSKTTDKPIADRAFLREFKEKAACPDPNESLRMRYLRMKKTIYQSSEIDKNTKIKMMFISNVKLSVETLKELREDADVEVDERRRITKFKANDGKLYLEGSHGMSSITKSFFSDRWQKIYQNALENESEEDDDKDTNCQKDKEKMRIDSVRFLIERTKNATSPLSISQLAIDYKKEFKSSEPFRSIASRIHRFRQRIREMNQLDTATKVKLAFALSVPIDAKFRIELQKGAIVELDRNQRIKKYTANDGSLELEGDHSLSAKTKAVWADNKKRRVFNNSSESEDDVDEEDSDEEEEDGEIVGESTRSKQTPTSSSARRSGRLQKSRITLQNKNNKRQLSEKKSDSAQIRNHARMSRGTKRARISDSSSETKNAEDPLNDEENLNYIPVEQKPESLIDTNNADEFDYDPSNYELDMDHLPIDKKPESLIEVNTEESSTTIVGNHYEENFFQYDQLNYVDEHIPEEKKPESLLEVKTELPEEPSTSNIEYHYEENSEHCLIEPKPEII